MAFLTTLALIIAALVAIAAAAIYFIGLPSEWTEAIQEKIVETAGENAASDAVRDQISKLPKADRKRAEQLQKGIGKVTGGDLKNPLGQFGVGSKTE